MSDGNDKFFTKIRASELLRELNQIDDKKSSSKTSIHRKKQILRKILANVTMNNNEMVNLFPEIIKMLEGSENDLELKKMLCYYFVTYSSNSSEFGSKALAILRVDLSSNSSLIKALALRTISSINLELNKFIPLLRQLLKDQDPYVRKTSCFAVSKIYEFNFELACGENLIESLNNLLNDENWTVVSAALASLSDITERHPSLQLTISKNHALTLIDNLHRCNEWSVIYVLNSLPSYVPQTSDDALLIIDKILPILQHENSSVVLNALKVLVFYSNYVRNPEDVIPSLSKRLGNSLVSMLSKPPEIQFLVLRNVILLLLSKASLVELDVTVFFCKYDDPIYVKDTKLEIIYLLADENNLDIVLTEFEEYATEVDLQMARKAIRAIGNLAVKIESTAGDCVEVLNNLIQDGISYIVQESAIVLKNILRKYPGKFNDSILLLISRIELIDEPDSKAAAIWIIGQYCDSIENSHLLLDDFSINLKDDPVDVQLCFLTAVVKLYVMLPLKSSDLLGRTLKMCTEETDNPDLRERGFYYWRLLSRDLETAKSIIRCDIPAISTDSDKIDQSILEELELNIGTLASIYLKPVQQLFRLSRTKALPESPALQRRENNILNSNAPKKKTQQQQRPKNGSISTYFNKNGSHTKLRKNSSSSTPLSERSETHSSFSDKYHDSTSGRNSDLSRDPESTRTVNSDIVDDLKSDFDKKLGHTNTSHSTGSGHALGRKLSMSFRKFKKHS